MNFWLMVFAVIAFAVAAFIPLRAHKYFGKVDFVALGFAFVALAWVVAHR